MPSPTSRSLDVCKKRGWVAGVVERRNPKMRFVTHDYLGVFDIIAAHPQIGVLAIQATSGTNHAAREQKVAEEPRALVWLASGARAEVWSFRKGGARGARKTWTLRRTRAFVVDGRIGWTPIEEDLR